jgi:hypothetical protein
LSQGKPANCFHCHAQKVAGPFLPTTLTVYNVETCAQLPGAALPTAALAHQQCHIEVLKATSTEKREEC